MIKHTGIFFLLLICGFNTKEDYDLYCNERFDFCIKYPKTFRLQETSENGDGAFFVSKDKRAEIWAYGRLAVEELDRLDQEFDVAASDIKLTYKLIKNTSFIFSGIDKDGEIVYQKTVRKTIDFYGDPGTYVFQTLRIKYPPGQKQVYDSYCTKISKSL
jgi:hypothetical protein